MNTYKIVEIVNREQSEVTVHLMGELTFTISLVETSKRWNNLHLSTSKKMDLGNGEKHHLQIRSIQRIWER